MSAVGGNRTRCLLLGKETSYRQTPTARVLPREDSNLDLLVQSQTRSRCATRQSGQADSNCRPRGSKPRALPTALCPGDALGETRTRNPRFKGPVHYPVLLRAREWVARESNPVPRIKSPLHDRNAPDPRAERGGIELPLACARTVFGTVATRCAQHSPSLLFNAAPGCRTLLPCSSNRCSDCVCLGGVRMGRAGFEPAISTLKVSWPLQTSPTPQGVIGGT